ncbi:MAG: hypothetical protein WA885_11410 [Phormidesmis sp.]
MVKAKQTSNDRRITVLSGLWPRLQRLAEEDDVAVADVVNAILLQSLRPYGICAAFATGVSPPAPFNQLSQNTGQHFVQNPDASRPQLPDPYKAAEIDSW